MDCLLKNSLREEILAQAKPLAIFGNGVSTQGAVRLLEQKKLKYILYDQDPKRGEFFDENSAEWHTMAICSPSFLSHHLWVILAKNHGLRCISELDLASLWCDAPIIGITGTNGKTTTTSFLTECFNHLGRRAFSAGNIGRSLSEVVACESILPNDIIFCEISSFQAETSRWIRLAHLIWTNFAPNHLDVHPTIRHYFDAKFHLLSLLKNDTSRLICGASVPYLAGRFGYQLPQNIKIARPLAAKNETAFSDYPQRENLAIIELFCEMYGITRESILTEARTFQRPKYRLKDMGMIDGNRYWNDSKCTNFAALNCALKNFPRESVIWIGGGRSKGEKLSEITSILNGKIAMALLIGETGAQLEPMLNKSKISSLYVKNIQGAINYIKNACFSGKTIVFSPAFSSFDQFENYVERGKIFESCIFSLKFPHR